jgi:hypothetical protein
MKQQIDKPKYKRAINLFHKQLQLNPRLSLPNFNLELRAIDFDDREIELFWNSNSELRLFRNQYEDEILIHIANEPEEFFGR